MHALMRDLPKCLISDSVIHIKAMQQCQNKYYIHNLILQKMLFFFYMQTA